jgi:hypothetical protein
LRRDSKSLLVSAGRWLLLVAALCLSACSTGVRLGYNYAETLVAYSLDGYVGLSDEQQQLVKERATALVAWHRSTQLRDYAELIETTRRRLDGPVTASDVMAFNQAINARLAALGERAAPDLAHLALTLSPDQIARLQRKLASDNSKARRELVQLAGKESLDERVKKYAERADFWFGSLTWCAPRWPSDLTTPAGGSRSASGGSASCSPYCRESRPSGRPRQRQRNG